MKNYHQLICRLSELLGIIRFYYNYRGNRIETSYQTKIRLISAMGIMPDEREIISWIDYLENNSWKGCLEPVYVTTQEHPIIYIYLKENQKPSYIEISPYRDLGQEGETLSLSLDFNMLNKDEHKILDNSIYFRYILPLPLLPIGYYNITAFFEKSTYESLLIVVPKHCFVGFKQKTWGLHINLWSLRGDKKEGNFSHLKEVAKFINAHGGFISINPLHLNDPEDLYGISPYSALSRQFNTPLYISKSAVNERNQEFFDYTYVWKEKISALRSEFEQFYKSYINQGDEVKRFISYKDNLCRAIREDLEFFAVFCFLRDKYGKDWQNWEERLRRPAKDTILRIYSEHNKDVMFYEYLQWCIEEEISEIKEYPICLDLAFGSIRSSFDVWNNQEVYAIKAEYGAPPDDFNPKGQKWGFSPFIPFRLRQKAYIPFIKILRANMKARLLRIDHALGLFRAFWIPEGATPDEGAYVKYPWKDLLSIITLESQINKTGIIGEDLGTAEDWMKEELIKRKINSWKVFYFEKSEFGYKPSSLYPEDALCSITTHDLPTLRGFWEQRDIKLRREFGIFDEQQFERAIIERQKDKEKIIEVLKQEGLIEEESIENLLIAIVKFLAKTKSRYLLLYPEDIMFVEEQTNIPGTTLEYPNWQRKYRLSFKEIVELPIFKQILIILSEAGRLHPVE